MNAKLRSLAGCIVAFGGFATLQSKADDAWADLPLIDLEAMVITGTRQESRLLKSPVSLSRIDSGEIQMRPTASVAELLRDIPGVFVADNTLPGMQRLRIRGEDARRSLVLVDGQEISDHSTFGPPLLMDPSLIESIEVVKGPHSTLYGSRAMGGVINIRTRKPSQQPIAFAASAGYHTATDGHRESMVASGTQGDWSYLFAGSNTEDQDRRIPGGTLSDTSHESSNFLGRVGWNRENHTFQLLYDTYKLSSEANTRDDLVDGFVISKFRLDLPRRDRERIGLLYEGVDLGPQLDRLKIDAFRQFNDRTIVQEIAGVVLPMTTPPSFYDYLNEDKDTIDTRGVNLQTDWDFLPGHTTIAGFNYLEDQLDKILERTGSLRKGPLQTPVKAELDTDAFIRTEAVYLNNQWELNPQWQLNAGIRHYRVRSGLEASNDPNLTVGGNRDSHTIGSASLVYAPDDSSAFRFAWSEGYVYPTLLHLHTGSLFGQGNLTRPNPFLKPETSTNYEIGYRLQRGAVTLDLALFGTESQNYIASVRASTVPELGWAPTENTYTNLDTASARGVEIDFEYRPENSDLSGYLRGTWLRRRQNYASFSTYDNGQPEMVGKVGLRYFRKVRELVFIHLDGNLAAGSEAELESTRSTRATSSWHTVNLSLGITFTGKQQWRIGLEAQNLTNELYQPSVDELYQPGRSLSAGVGFDF